MQPIAFIETSFKQKFGTPRQGELTPSSRGRIVLRRQYWDQGFLDGLEGFSHLWILSQFHLNLQGRINGKVTPPRLEKPVGVFSTRSPHRPNPLGLTLVRQLSLEENAIEVSEVDLVDGTPILDIKPYIPEDRPADPKFGWIEELKPSRIPVEWGCPEVQVSTVSPRQRKLIEETLTINPLPLVYRPMIDRDFWVRVETFDVRFKNAPDRFCILEIKQITP